MAGKKKGTWLPFRHPHFGTLLLSFGYGIYSHTAGDLLLARQKESLIEEGHLMADQMVVSPR
jgi:hypothetical protein